MDYEIKPILILEQENLPTLNQILNALLEEGNIPLFIIDDEEDETFKSCLAAKPPHHPDLLVIIFTIKYNKQFLA